MGILQRMAQKSVARNCIRAMAKLIPAHKPVHEAIFNTIAKTEGRNLNTADVVFLEELNELGKVSKELNKRLVDLVDQCELIIEGYDVYSNDLQNNVAILQGAVLALTDKFYSLITAKKKQASRPNPIAQGIKLGQLSAQIKESSTPDTLEQLNRAYDRHEKKCSW